jgi:hypothetical protein
MEQENKIVEETQKEQAIADNATEIKTEQQTENPNEINWRKFREQREIERKAKEEAERNAAKSAAEAAALKKAMEALLENEKRPAQASYQDDDQDDNHADSIRKEVAKALELERQKQQIEQAERERKEFPQKLVSVFPDFDQVCNSENLDYLEYHYPEVAAGFKHMPDNFDKWQNIYKAVKRFIPNADSKKDEKRMEKNLNKPQSASLSGMTATGDVAPSKGLDEERRKANWSRMQRVMRSVK